MIKLNFKFFCTLLMKDKILIMNDFFYQLVFFLKIRFKGFEGKQIQVMLALNAGKLTSLKLFPKPSF